MSPELINAFSDLGFIGALIVAVYAYATGKVVTGASLSKVETKCDLKIAGLESKIEAAAVVAIKQSEAQAETIKVLHTTIVRLEAKA